MVARPGRLGLVMADRKRKRNLEKAVIVRDAAFEVSDPNRSVKQLTKV